MQDAEKMKEAGAKSRIECYNSRALYDSMLKILERFLQEKIEVQTSIEQTSSEKRVKILDTEVENRLEIMKKLLVQNTGIDNLELQETNCKDLKFINQNEVHNQNHSNIQQKTGSEAISVLHLPTEGESCERSEDKNGVSTSVADDFVRILSQAYKDDLDLHSIPSMTVKNIVATRLALLDEIKKEKSADEETMAEKMKQCVCQVDVKMENSSSSKIALEGSTKIILKLAQASQPLEDHDKLLSQCTQVDFRKLKPEWLERFFKRTFFEPCSEHPIRRNELNKYCIDCDASLCQYCVSLASHANHRLLKIYRHVYKDVVPLDEIERHIDCSLIQPYRCNRQLVIALTPLPHSGTKTIEEATCQTCKRKLIEYDVYSYCSISCKVEAFMKKQNDFVPPFLLLDQVEENPEQESVATKTRKRKGIPHRSPFS